MVLVNLARVFHGTARSAKSIKRRVVESREPTNSIFATRRLEERRHPACPPVFFTASRPKTGRRGCLRSEFGHSRFLSKMGLEQKPLALNESREIKEAWYGKGQGQRARSGAVSIYHLTFVIRLFQGKELKAITDQRSEVRSQ